MAKYQATVNLLTSKDSTEKDYYDRHFVLTPTDNTIIIGRASRRHTERGRPTTSNATFDSPVISREHAKLWLDQKRVLLEDSGSLHGTSINGNKLETKKPQEVKHGDSITIGSDVSTGDKHFMSREYKLTIDWNKVASEASIPPSKSQPDPLIPRPVHPSASDLHCPAMSIPSLPDRPQRSLGTFCAPEIYSEDEYDDEPLVHLSCMSGSKEYPIALDEAPLYAAPSQAQTQPSFHNTYQSQAAQAPQNLESFSSDESSEDGVSSCGALPRVHEPGRNLDVESEVDDESSEDFDDDSDSFNEELEAVFDEVTTPKKTSDLPSSEPNTTPESAMSNSLSVAEKRASMISLQDILNEDRPGLFQSYPITADSADKVATSLNRWIDRPNLSSHAPDQASTAFTSAFYPVNGLSGPLSTVSRYVPGGLKSPERPSPWHDSKTQHSTDAASLPTPPTNIKTPIVPSTGVKRTFDQLSQSELDTEQASPATQQHKTTQTPVQVQCNDKVERVASKAVSVDERPKKRARGYLKTAGTLTAGAMLGASAVLSALICLPESYFPA